MENGYSKSILDTHEGVDYVADKLFGIADRSRPYTIRHEVFYGTANRSNSKKYGCWVNISPYMHRIIHDSPNEYIDLWLKRTTQRKFEQLYSHKKFMEIFGRSWL